MEQNEVKSRELDGLGRVVLPQELRAKLGWNPKDELAFSITNDGILLQKTDNNS